MSREQFAWSEKYRPKTIAECVLPDSLKESFTAFLQNGDLPNLLLCGRSGIGKTTVARALMAELESDFMLINASDENGIDVLRNKIKEFASAYSFDSKRRKYVILDEADHLTAATQPALRAFVEEFAHTTGFIFTANSPERIIPALHSRCSRVDFKIPAKERPAIAAAFYKRVAEVLKTEGVEFNARVLQQVVMNYFPDFRRTLNELQRFSATGTLSEAILSQISDKDVEALFAALKSRQYSDVVKFVRTREDLDATAFYRMMSDKIERYVEDESLPACIVHLADYSYKAAFTPDIQLNILACLTELMHSARFTK